MRTEQIKQLIQLNNSFYRVKNSHFSATRQSFWPGWKRVLEVFHNEIQTELANVEPIMTLDCASGNLRFERFLSKNLPDTPLQMTALDCSVELLSSADSLNLPSQHTLDVIQTDLIESVLSSEQIHDQPAHLCVAFGFFHHIPTDELRCKMLNQMFEATQSRGVVAVSLWQFMKNDVLAKQAILTHEEALKSLPALEAGDFYLGWNAEPGVYRYCHNFSTEDIAEIVQFACEVCGNQLLDRFESDGRSGNLNTYLIFKKA